MYKLKNVGIISTIAGSVIFILSALDLFGQKILPVPIAVTGLVLGIMATFTGPALIVIPFSNERRKKITQRAFYLSITLIALGWASKWLHFMGAGIEIILGILIFCFFYGTLSFKNKYEKWKLYSRSKRDAFFLSLFDYLGIGALALGILFKKQHWPLAQELGLIGLGILAVGVLAWNQKFKKEVVFRKEAEDKLKELLTEIESQKHLVEEKQREIIDSIVYAKRIQQSRMPSETYIEQTLNRLIKK